ncbi:MAG TPA: hypothetical protein PK926_11065 [Spirochaetota bacterium]|nr:hypothetical protein [Spirochaetota bacterium]HPI88410.1 hypothetical protein [Spirochaetota bacterium]
MTVEQLDQLFERYPQSDLDLKYFDRLSIRGQNFLTADLVLKSHIDVLRQNKIGEIEVFYTPVMYEFLCEEFPETYRRPVGRISFVDMDRYLETLDDINTHSHRKRFISIVGDIYGIDHKEGKRIKILCHGDKLNYRKWNTIKREVSKNQQFLYRNSEWTIIVFVNLSLTADEDYVERFKKNTDLISILVSKKQECNEEISPDFVPTEDVISVTDPDRLLAEYISGNARLIIIGENLNDSYKKALLDVRRYDKYVRMIVVPSLDHKNLDHFLRQVKLVYNSDRWS